MSRNVDTVAGIGQKNTLHLDLDAQWERDRGNPWPVMLSETAIQMIVGECRKGALVSLARRLLDGRPGSLEPMNSAEWVERTLRDNKATLEPSWEQRESRDGEWSGVCFARDDLLRLWPPEPERTTITAVAVPNAATEPHGVARVSELSGGDCTESVYPAIGVIPEHLHLTACEVLTWIGYGRAISKDVYFAEFAKASHLPGWSAERTNLLHRSVPDPKPYDDPMNDAGRKLMEHLRAKRLTWFVRRNSRYEEGDPEILEYAVTVNARGAIEADWTATERDRCAASDYLKSCGPLEVFFRASEVLTLPRWPFTPGSTACVAVGTTALAQLRDTPEDNEKITEAIAWVYREAEAQGFAPPNVRDIQPLAAERLQALGLTTGTLAQIGRVAESPGFKALRAPVGKTHKQSGLKKLSQLSQLSEG
jgi:hypothetical protein